MAARNGTHVSPRSGLKNGPAGPVIKMFSGLLGSVKPAVAGTDATLDQVCPPSWLRRMPLTYGLPPATTRNEGELRRMVAPLANMGDELGRQQKSLNVSRTTSQCRPASLLR